MYGVSNSNFRKHGGYKTLASFATTVAFSVIVSSTSLLAASDLVPSEFDQDILAAVAELHGISEDQAVNRLAKEQEAAIIYKFINDLSIKSYAGSWFDESSSRLKVAIADPEDVVHLEVFNVDPVNVKYSLTDLKNKLIQATSKLDFAQSGSAPINSYIDYKSNTVVLGVRTEYLGFAQSDLDSPEYSDSVRVVEFDNYPTLSTGFVRGADGTNNLTWDQQAPNVAHPCSIGASVEDGFITAGHCGFLGHDIGDADSDPLGTVTGSIWDLDNPGLDTGWVTTDTGWTPSPLINGYTDGVFSVSAEWGGILESPVGSTVCRYGGTSGGPHCGTVDQLNQTQSFYLWTFWNGTAWEEQWKTVTGLTKVEGSCSDPGDSGGTWITGTGQFQGTNTGKSGYDPAFPCPTQVDYTYFQPFEDAANEWDVTLLTSHGSSAPSITSVSCPNMAISGQGFYQCLVRKVDSQGEVGIQWTTSTSASSTGLWVSDNCTPLQMVTVTLKATNPYGTTTKNYSFRCPSGPIQ